MTYLIANPGVSLNLSFFLSLEEPKQSGSFYSPIIALLSLSTSVAIFTSFTLLMFLTVCLSVCLFVCLSVCDYFSVTALISSSVSLSLPSRLFPRGFLAISYFCKKKNVPVRNVYCITPFQIFLFRTTFGKKNFAQTRV